MRPRKDRKRSQEDRLLLHLLSRAFATALLLLSHDEDVVFVFLF